MKSAYDLTERLFKYALGGGTNKECKSRIEEAIEARDSEHAAALAKVEERCRVLEEACRKVLNAWRMNGLINSDSRQGTMILELLYSVLYEMEPIAEDTKLARAALEGE